MYTPFTEALEEFLRRVEWNGKEVPVVWAGPDRAFSEVERVMKRRAQGHPKSVVTGREGLAPQAARDRNAWVPFMSVLVQPFSYDSSRFNPRSFRKVKVNQAALTAQNMRFPRPVTSEVQVDLWAGSDAGWMIASHVSAQVELMFRAESVYLTIDWSQPRYYKPPFNTLEHAREYGVTGFRLINNGWQDNSELETGDAAKNIRWTWTARIEGYLPYALDEARIIRSVELDMVQDLPAPATDLVLDTLVSGSED